jgi:hypothetical protein
MVHMSRAYLTEKQMPRKFWYYKIEHSAWMMNMIPGRYKNKLAYPLCWSTMCAQIKELGSQFSLCVISITRKTVMPHVPKTKHTPLTASSSGDHQHPMPS